MKELDMIKAFAELEGLRFNDDDCRDDGSIWINCYDWYNPLTSLALNCAARDKYKVEVAYWLCSVCIDEGNHSGQASFESQSINLAVIECILKSKGKWEY